MRGAGVKGHEERMCVLLPLGEELQWAVPQSCLAEIITLQPECTGPPASVAWRGLDVPVLDLGEGGAEPWLDSRTGAGLIAVMLGVAGQGCDYWAVALRGVGVAAHRLVADDCEDRPDAIGDNALAAFSLNGNVYQVPDLPALQQQAAASMAGAVTTGSISLGS
jgi:hypothetical protein